MNPKTIKEKVEWYSLLNKQNLNGRETEDELFEAGILVGIEETEELRDEFTIQFSDWMAKEYWLNSSSKYTKGQTHKELLQIFKKEKGYDT